MLPESKPAPVTVCTIWLVLLQVMLPPAFTCTVPGANRVSVIVTVTAVGAIELAPAGAWVTIANVNIPSAPQSAEAMAWLRYIFFIVPPMDRPFRIGPKQGPFRMRAGGRGGAAA